MSDQNVKSFSETLEAGGYTSGGPVTEARNTELLEELAALEHEQWKDWALAILDSEEISPARAKRWLDIVMKGGYRNLTEQQKDQDRAYAEKVLWVVKKHMGIKQWGIKIGTVVLD